jgi:hypothetical protein
MIEVVAAGIDPNVTPTPSTYTQADPTSTQAVLRDRSRTARGRMVVHGERENIAGQTDDDLVSSCRCISYELCSGRDCVILYPRTGSADPVESGAFAANHTVSTSSCDRTHLKASLQKKMNPRYESGVGHTFPTAGAPRRRAYASWVTQLRSHQRHKLNPALCSDGTSPACRC